MTKKKNNAKAILDPNHDFANDIELGTYIDARERYDYLNNESQSSRSFEESDTLNRHNRDVERPNSDHRPIRNDDHKHDHCLDGKDCNRHHGDTAKATSKNFNK